MLEVEWEVGLDLQAVLYVFLAMFGMGKGVFIWAPVRVRLTCQEFRFAVLATYGMAQNVFSQDLLAHQAMLGLVLTASSTKILKLQPASLIFVPLDTHTLMESV